LPYITTINPDSATGLLKRVYDGGVSRAGSVAKVMEIMSQHPESLRTSMAFYKSLMLDGDVLPRDAREMMATVVSNVNDCYY